MVLVGGGSGGAGGVVGFGGAVLVLVIAQNTIELFIIFEIKLLDCEFLKELEPIRSICKCLNF